MYDWAFKKKIDVGGDGFFVRTHSDTPYLWVDNGSDELVLIDKKDLSVKKIIPVKSKKNIHTEFSGDGRIAYISIFEKDGSLELLDASTLEKIRSIPSSFPVGKYNFVNKLRRFDSIQLGKEVFMKKCWGCHHPTREAFGPSFSNIIKKRDVDTIKAYIMDPESMYMSLGYKKNTMPKMELKEKEIDMLLGFIRNSKDK